MSLYLTVYEALSATAAGRGSAPALKFGELEISYAELMKRIDDTAAALTANGIGYGDAFAVFAQNHPGCLYCYYAAARVGAVYVPINPNMTAAEVGYIVSHCEAKALFHDSVVASAALREVPAGSRRSLDVLLGSGSHTLQPAGSESISSHDDFLIIYTSGSTGTPKAVVLDHAAQVAVCESLIELWGISDRDTTLVALPLGYLYGLSTAAAVGLRAGGLVVLLPKFRPRDVLEAFGVRRATVFHGVPTMFSMMLEYAEQNHVTYDLSFVRLMISAGAPLSDEVAERFVRSFGKELQNYYALTECTPIFGKYASDPRPLPRSAAGKKAPGAAVKIVGPNQEECGPGVEGELYMRAAATLKCYRKDPALTAASLKDGWFKSGDLGRYDENGYYYITGRVKDIIIRGGANISPSEVEQVLSRHPAVHEVAVVGVPDRIFGEVPVAFVVKRAGYLASAEELMKHAESELADFKVPRQYSFEESLPLGKTGKVDKNALTALWQAQRSLVEERSHLPPREQALWDAQQRAEALFDRVIERGLLLPGRTESAVSAAIFQLAREEFGVRRHWHRRIVRCGANTLLTYYEEGPDRCIASDDLVFLDFGPVFAGWEADLGRSYVVGADPAKRRLVDSIGTAFRSGQALFESTPELTAGELYDHVAALAVAGGWRFGAASAGHPVDAFPHERQAGRRYIIEHGNPLPLRQPLSDGRVRHWILEIHFVDDARGYGAFCEELLTVRGPRSAFGQRA